MFGTNLLPRSPNINYHYEISLPMTLHPDRFDGVLFGSSRTQATPTAELSRRINGVTFANFSVIRGMLPDFLPALEYVLADKAKRGQRVRASVSPPRYRCLRRSRSNQPLHRDLASSPERRKRRVLLVAQSDGSSGQELAAYPARGPGRDRGKIRQAPSALERVKWALVRVAALSGLAARGAQAGSDYNRPFGQRTHFAEQLQLQRIAALSRQSGAELIVAVSPLHRAVESRYLPKDLSQALDQVARVTPLWDFTGADWLSDDPNYWMGDTAHYSSQVSHMMLARIFGDPMPRGWERFGQLEGG